MKLVFSIYDLHLMLKLITYRVWKLNISQPSICICQRIHMVAYDTSYTKAFLPYLISLPWKVFTPFNRIFIFSAEVQIIGSISRAILSTQMNLEIQKPSRDSRGWNLYIFIKSCVGLYQSLGVANEWVGLILSWVNNG